MAYPDTIRKQVQLLRAKGKTYSEILKEISTRIPKSTLSNWCRNVILPDWYQGKIDEINKTSFSKGLAVAHASLKIKREKLLSELRIKDEGIVNRIFDKDFCKCALAMLYLGEGAKWKFHGGLMLGSSEPDIVLLYLRLLEICYGIDPKSLKCRICYRADQNINELEKYWSKTTGIPLENFYKTAPDPRTVGKPTRNGNYKGVCAIMGGGTVIQLELEQIPGLILEKIEMGR
jgi:hypothetical protein